MNILICITGGIAVYKVADLVNYYTKEGNSVKVVMSENACKFVTPLTFQTLSKQTVITDTFDEENPNVINHIYYPQQYADVIIVAPATANIIGKIAHGIADEIVSTTILAANKPVILVPSMNTVMYESWAVQDNLKILKQKGYTIVEPDEGLLACGVYGKGHFPSMNKIIEAVQYKLECDLKYDACY